MEYILDDEQKTLCEPLMNYRKEVVRRVYEMSLFNEEVESNANDICVAELFAGVGGFRIGLERASKRFKTVWSNQWEPSTKRQDASIVYCKRFGCQGHSNNDIATVAVSEIPDVQMLVGGFPCQDYSVATTLKNSGGIEGKKGVLWWQIHRILRDKAVKPMYLMLENVDRILKSPVSQRGRDFAIILASLSDLGYAVEWRVINAAEYGMPQRRRRTYIIAYHKTSPLYNQLLSNKASDWVLENGTFAKAFPCTEEKNIYSQFTIDGDLAEVSAEFNKNTKPTAKSPFCNTGLMIDRNVYSVETSAKYDGAFVTLGDILIDEKDVPAEFFIKDEDVAQWKYLKGGKSEKRVNKTTGYEYNYSEGSMAFPDAIDKPSRTIITGEGGNGASRFKHVIETPSGRLRRLTPIELERLNMFPDNHTESASDVRRAFLMGNALVTGIVEWAGRVLLSEIDNANV